VNYCIVHTHIRHRTCLRNCLRCFCSSRLWDVMCVVHRRSRCVGQICPFHKCSNILLNDIALLNKSSHSYGTSPAIMGSLSVTCHQTQENTPRLTPAIQSSWYSINLPPGMEGWVCLIWPLQTVPLHKATFSGRRAIRCTVPTIMELSDNYCDNCWLNIAFFKSRLKTCLALPCLQPSSFRGLATPWTSCLHLTLSSEYTSVLSNV